MAIGSTLKETKGNLYFGQNPYGEGFVGEIGDAYYYFYALKEHEIAEIYEK